MNDRKGYTLLLIKAKLLIWKNKKNDHLLIWKNKIFIFLQHEIIGYQK